MSRVVFWGGGCKSLGPFNATSGTVAISTSVTRNGVASLHVSPASAGTGYADLRAFSAVGAFADFGLSSHWGRVYLRVDTLPASGSEEFLVLIDAPSTRKMSYRLHSDGTFSAWNTSGTTQHGSNSSAAIAAGDGTWHQFEWHCESSTGAFEAKLDGYPILSGTGVALGGALTGVLFGKVVNRNGNTVDIYYSEASIDDAGYPGFAHMRPMIPDSAGNYAAWTLGAGTGAGLWDLCEETPHDGATSYVVSTLTLEDAITFGLVGAAAAGISGTIVSVKVVGYLRRHGVALCTFRLRSRLNGTDYDGTNDMQVSGVFLQRGYMLNAAIDDAGAWTLADLDGVELGAVEKSETQQTRLTLVYLEVEFRPLVVAEGTTTIRAAATSGLGSGAASGIGRAAAGAAASGLGSGVASSSGRGHAALAGAGSPSAIAVGAGTTAAGSSSRGTCSGLATGAGAAAAGLAASGLGSGVATSQGRSGVSWAASGLGGGTASGAGMTAAGLAGSGTGSGVATGVGTTALGLSGRGFPGGIVIVGQGVAVVSLAGAADPAAEPEAMGFYERTANAVRARWESGVTLAPTSWDNADQDPQGSWIRMRVRFGAEEAVRLGTPPLWRCEGAVRVEMRVPLRGGDAAALRILDEARASFFDGASEDGVRYGEISTISNRRVGSRWALEIEIPFRADREEGPTVEGGGRISYEQAANVVRDRFAQLVEAPNALLTYYDDQDESRIAASSTWCRFSVLFADPVGVEVAGARTVTGRATAMLYAPIREGTKSLHRLADMATPSFRGAAVGGVEFGAPSVRDRGRERKWWRVDLVCPFSFELS